MNKWQVIETMPTTKDPIRVLANEIFDEHCGYTIFQEDEDDTIAEIAFGLENLVDQHAAEAKADQREMCADAVIAELKSIGFQIYESGEDRIRAACLRATGESDEGELMTSLDNQTSSDNPDNNISPIENPGSLFSNSSKATAELSNRVRRHLERVDERECSLDAWNCICDALGELE